MNVGSTFRRRRENWMTRMDDNRECILTHPPHLPAPDPTIIFIVRTLSSRVECGERSGGILFAASAIAGVILSSAIISSRA